MKNKASNVFLSLAVISLIGTGIVYATGFFKNKNNNQTNRPTILGENTDPGISPTSFINFQQIVQNTVQNTKDTVSQKMTEKISEGQKTVVQTIEKEISKLTQSQIEALKLQICRDWGIIIISPTPKLQE